MSESVEEGKDITRGWVSESPLAVKRVLDIGTGRGTYWNKFGQTGQVLGHAEWIGVEAYQPYIDAWQLTKKYNTILNEDARTLDYSKLGHFEIAFAGDVLEHMTKEEAIKLVEELKKCCDKLYISIPIIHLPQHADANPFQEHVKDDWSHEEVMESFPVKRHWAGTIVGVYEV
jgi:2-polyprenyl-3-methyl-5-hydroxy-6-metoxy-1,4-benzoquinol methylase